MHPLFAHRWVFFWFQTGCLFVGLIVALLLYLIAGLPLISTLGLCLPLSLITGFYLSSAYYVSRAQPINRRRLSRVMLSYASVCGVSALVFASTILAWDMWLGWSFPNYQGLHHASTSAAILVVIGFTLYLLALLAFDLFLTIEGLHQSEKQAAQAQLMAREAELHALRNQIDPHFLFNALNSISALTSFDAQAARTMTIELAEFFRLTLSTSQREKISLHEELSICQHFLSVEKIRYDEKIRSNIQIESGLERALVPPMLLQPLFENAIKHGLRHLSQGGAIDLQIERRFDCLSLSICNPYPEKKNTSGVKGSGIGLSNLRQRLRALYQDQARVSWQAQQGLFSLDIVIPLEWKHHEV